MAAGGNTGRGLSPVLIVGATSFAIVVGVGAARYATAVQSTQASAVTTEVKAASSIESPINVQSEATTTVPSDSSAEGDDIESTTSQGAANSSRASVTVNGQTYSVSDGEQLHTTTTDNNGQTSIDISVQSSGSGQQYGSASSNVHVFSQSSTTAQSNGSTTP